MALHQLRPLDGESVGVTIPKDDLRVDGLLGPDGELVDDRTVHIDHQGNGEWTVEVVEDL